ncbi:probable protein phosphatase 2C 40 isoform X1 [Macadamia integrifolia]|uniref:probable protein phosphatase 2C 40 isoform X1 n=2 Tax=Macadamia integrifolia TaxID=60698 RepID=UPI001C4E9282|nr:probable protein phosphatase 2C 40 isoform X1 [Macadamia integrifolia]XP_042511314.1 probable protein phosphatase 2C 40 isoform X1 [Macadamia integrifolia]XP_042511323.1 probable protein phosphatase 2C 40 isoform X1 [Macadamia integrifolia]
MQGAVTMLGEIINGPDGELKVSFGYQCNGNERSSCELYDGCEISSGAKLPRNNSSFCLSGAALSANATLANTNICNGLIGEGILPGLDSPKSFRRVPSSPSFSRLDILSSSLQSSGSILSSSVSTQSEPSEWDFRVLNSMSAPSGSEGFLNAGEVQVAGGAAGEDRVQAVCSEENGWLFCGIYDGFNGRDAADFLAGTLYETIVFYLGSLDLEPKQDTVISSDGSLSYFLEDSIISSQKGSPPGIFRSKNPRINNVTIEGSLAKEEDSNDLFRKGVLDSLQHALSQAENDFLHMVEQEMEDRPDLVSIGSCVLIVLLHRNDLYVLNLGDSRAVLATYGESIDEGGTKSLEVIQLTDSHTVDNEVERRKLLNDHPDDPAAIVAGKVKGKLKVTRAFGVGYLKKKKMNDVLMGILRVQSLLSPPYISTQPSVNIHRISKNDHFVIVASDGLFDFFSNDEAVKLVLTYILSNPFGDPAKFLLEQLVLRAANSAGFSTEELMRIPAGRRRKYHDDVTVIVIILGRNQRTSTASTCL